MNWILLSVVLGTSLLLGVAIVATAGGAIYPPLIKIAQPLVCDGELEVKSGGYSYKPGQSGTTHNIYCVNPTTQDRVEMTIKSVFVAGLIYSAIIFVVLLPIGYLMRNNIEIERIPSRKAANLRFTVEGVDSSQKQATTKSATDRINELKALLGSGLITQKEFDRKREEILKDI